MALTHEDICRIAADLAYEEHMKQTNNVITEPIDNGCPRFSIKEADCRELKQIERTNLCIQDNMEIPHN